MRLQQSISIGALSLILGLTFFADSNAGGQSANWVGGVGVWSDPNNWSCMCVPNNQVNIVNGGTAMLDINAATNELVLDSGSTLNISGFTLTNALYDEIGATSTASVNVYGGGVFNEAELNLGIATGSNGSVTVSGIGSQLNLSIYGLIGDQGAGSLTIQNGGVVNVSGVGGGLFLAQSPGSNGTATVTGAGSQLNLTAPSSTLGVGSPAGGNGSLSIQNHGIVNVAGVVETSTANSSVNVTGVGSQLNAALVASGPGAITISLGASGSGGLTSEGSITLTDVGTSWNANGLQITAAIGGNGTINVKNGAVLSNGGLLLLGCCSGNYTGILNVSTGGIVQTSSAELGSSLGATGNVSVSGSGSQWANTGGPVLVGVAGNGGLSLQQGGVGQSNSGLDIGVNASGVGAMLLSDPSTAWTNSGGQVVVGDRGTGSLIVEDGAVLKGGSDIVVGNFGTGTLTIGGGGTTIASGNTVIGGQANSNGTVLVTLSGTQWNNSGSVSVGMGGQGALTVQAGASVSSGGTLDIGQLAGSKGTATITDAGTTWDNSFAGIIVGDAGTGTLNIQNGAQFSNPGPITVGNSGKGTLGINGGSQLFGSTAVVGFNSGSSGSATGSGPGSIWNVGSQLYIGYAGQGTLNVNSAGAVTAIVMDIGEYGGSVGQVTVSGSGSTLSAAQLLLGYSGRGSLIAKNGALVTSGNAQLGFLSAANGTVIVDGAGSGWDTSLLQIGLAGNATVAAQNQGGITISNSLFVGQNGILIFQGGGTVTVDGNATNNGIELGRGGSSLLNVIGTLTNSLSGTFALQGPGDVANVGVLVNTGGVFLLPSTTLNLTNQPSGVTDVVGGSTFNLAGVFNAGANSGFYQLTSVEGNLILANGQTTTTTPIGGTFTVGSAAYIEVVTGTTFDINGNVVINPGGTLSANDPFSTGVNITGILTNNGGHVNVIGPNAFLNVGGIGNGGTLTLPEGSTVNLANGFYQLAQGTLGETIGASGFAILAVNGGFVMLDGTLDIMLDAGFNPGLGTTYDFLTFNPGLLSGTFSSIVSRPFNNDTEYWVIQYSNTGGFVSLTAEPVPEPSSLLLLGSGLLLGMGILRCKLNP